MTQSHWRTLFDSVAGTSHVESNKPCQDACRVITAECNGEAVLIAACADGAGSASRSEVGATIGCDSIVEAVRMDLLAKRVTFNREQVIAWFSVARDAVVREAEQLGLPPRELASTLLVAVVFRDEAIFAQVGDGAIILKDADTYRVIIWPQSGEYANTTNFLTNTAIDEVVEFEHYQGSAHDIAMFTDGLERLALRFDDRTVHSPFFQPLFSGLRSAPEPRSLFAALREFLDSPAVNARTDDDKTLILASRMSAEHEDA